MFTGIVRLGSITSIVHDAGQHATHMVIAAPQVATALGQSIAINGICLTVTAFSAADFSVTLSPETMRVTTAGSWQVGDSVNIEPALLLGDRMDGHIVSGHVDGVGRITAIAQQGSSSAWEMEVPEALAKYIAPKGSIALDGASLTVNQVVGNRFTVMLIPHTLAVTIFGDKQVGDAVNIEVDMLARYVERLMHQGHAA